MAKDHRFFPFALIGQSVVQRDIFKKISPREPLPNR